MILRNGTYTITDGERHYTVRLHTKDFNGEAMRVVELLTGPDNTDFGSWTGLGFYHEDGEQPRACMWKKHRAATTAGHAVVTTDNWNADWSKVTKKVAVFLSLATGGETWRARGYSVLEESRCIRCNRKLTTPESIEAGIGPECANK
jgi:hypothetical protein